MSKVFGVFLAFPLDIIRQKGRESLAVIKLYCCSASPN
jgi:hypothetical protein